MLYTNKTKTVAVFHLLMAAALLLRAASATSAADDLAYNRDIRPILSDKCFFCHGPDEEERQADLRLDIEDAAKQSAIDVDDLAASELLARITSDDESLKMPPPDSGKSLTPEEIKTLTVWVKHGAEYQPYWAYVPPRRVTPPQLDDDTWSSSDIDRFIYAQLKRNNLQPAPDADPITLIRRLYFDLIGLPPTPETVAAFVADQSPTSYERIVDELLASQHFGERLAIYWLDLVRYADTVGYHGDQDQSISPYRDWVIDALNDNMPFDEFTRQQLAGDLVDDSNLENLIATGYNRLLQTSHEGGVQPKEYLAIYAADRVRNLSVVWMGATMGCCQCHNHKFDPYTIKDFYSMAAFFADVDEADHFTSGSNALPTLRRPEIPIYTDEEKAKLAEIQQALDQLPEDAQERKTLEREKRQVETNARRTMITKSIEPREMRVLPRGNWLDDSGPIVQPAIPEFLGTVNSKQDRATRLDLANWLTDPEQGVGGLTARVQANRLWYLLFGTGLSRSLDDFGGQGEPPTDPDLLDHLALEFVDSGWNIKATLKQIVMSHAYRQSSVASLELRQRDPANQLFARQGAYRLPAEMIRDNALAISGLLNTDYNGPSSKPYQPAGYYRHLNFPTREYEADQGPSQYRRGVYTHWQRQFLHPMLKAFDAPTREECTAQRPRSNTPLAALVLLNDPTFVEAGRVFAERILTDRHGDDQAKLQFAYQLALSRDPEPAEQAILLNLLTANREAYTRDQGHAQSLLKTGLHTPHSDINEPELAAWTSVTRAILNLNETITRN